MILPLYFCEFLSLFKVDPLKWVHKITVPIGRAR